jgi:hypothetical protein
VAIESGAENPCEEPITADRPASGTVAWGPLCMGADSHRTTRPCDKLSRSSLSRARPAGDSRARTRDETLLATEPSGNPEADDPEAGRDGGPAPGLSENSAPKLSLFVVSSSDCKL